MHLSFVRDDTIGLPISLAMLSGVAAIAMAILLFYPEVSDSFWRRTTAALRGLVNALSRSGRAIARRVARPTMPRARLHVRLRRRWPVVVLAAMLAIPGALILLWDGQPRTASFGRSATYDTDPAGAVSALLRGEHLTPPAALPPAIFATREIELIRPRLVYASRAWELLDDAFAQRLLRVYQLMKERHGYDMVLIEGYRSPERQNELAGLGSHVTGAAAFQSYHQYGLAADSAFLKEGRLVISEKDPWAMQGYRLFGVLAAELGLTWGGNWTLRDFGHVEWRQRRRGP
jgi:peptidoglycan LD-endopeptidase CwlK